MPVPTPWVILVVLLGVTTGTGAQDKPPTFPAETRVVALDVVATDRDGRPLDDLRPDEFQILENGRTCEIRSFRRIGAPLSGEGSGTHSAAEKEVAVPPSSASPPVGATQPLTNLVVLFFDRLTIESGRVARQGALDFLARNSSHNARFAVFSGVRGQFVVPFTNDLAVVRNGVMAATFGGTPSAGVPGDAPPPPGVDLDTIYAIEGVARELEPMEGRKTILYFAEGWQFPLKVRPEYEEAISTATRANVTVHTFDARGLAYRKRVAATPFDRVLESLSAENRGGPFGGRMTPLTDAMGTPVERLAGPNVEDLAQDTGGRAIADTNDLRAGLAGISEELWHYYEIVYAPADPANDGRFRRISVKVSRPGVSIRTRKGYFAITRDTRTLRANERPPAVDPRPTPDASLVPILERAASYVVGYEESFQNVVAEETYLQSVFVGTTLATGLVPAMPSGPGLGPPMPPLLNEPYRKRTTRADLVFVRLAVDVPWSLFRDVFEVDGRKVRDRDRRLEMLFQHPSPSALDQERRIVEESARYNIGGAARTINVPTMPLVFLHPRNQLRLSFTKGGRRSVSGVAALEVRFEEVARPTIVTTSSGDSLPAHGSFWIDSSSGAVLRTEVVFSFEPSLAEASVETDYKFEQRLNLWVPVEMKERYRNLPRASASVFGAPTEATARYSNFRQFSVTVEQGTARTESQQ
jgi:VWFA-related protein